MNGRDRHTVRLVLAAAAALLLLTSEAHAYAGPVPGPEFFGYFLSLIGWLALTFSALLLWPVQALWRRIRGIPPEEPPAEETSAPADPGPAVS